MTGPSRTAPMSDPAPLDYASLTPHVVLDALDQVGLPADGRILQLNSYENRVFQAYLDDGSAVVIKFYRPQRWSDAQILEEHGFSLELAGAEIPVVAPMSFEPGGTLLPFRDGHRFAVTACKPGRSPELDDPATLRWIGRFLGRIHAIGATRPFVHRASLDVATFGDASRATLVEGGHLASDLAVAWTTACDLALSQVRAAFERAPMLVHRRLHGDCHRGNVLWSDSGPHFVDLDDAVNGPAVQDLWMLLSGDRSSMTRQLLDLLEGYEDFCDFDWRECALIEPLRTLRMIHHSAWIARRWSDPAFPAAFPWFGSADYWQQQTAQLHEQVEAMQSPPLGAPG